jgi:hypothetical protein
MRIQAQQNIQNTVATQAKYKTQHVVEPAAGLEAVSLMAKDGFVNRGNLPTVGAKAPDPLIIKKEPGNEPAAQPAWVGVAAWVFNPFKGASAVGAIGEAIGQAVAGFIAGVFNFFGGLMKGPEPQPALPAPATVAPTTEQPSEADRARLGQVFDTLDENGDGRLTGPELTQNALFKFDSVTDAGKTREQFIEEAFKLEREGGVTLTVDAVRANSPRSRIAELMNEVWDTSALFNETSFAWWKGILKEEKGDYDRLRERMVSYKQDIDKATKGA